MKTAISSRRAKFQRLIVQACAQSTPWLEANVRDCGKYATRLSILACLRVLAGRDSSGAVYRVKRRAILTKLRSA